MARKSVAVLVQEHGPVNDVLLAINHYITTGDHYGEGTALDAGAGVLAFVIPYDPFSPQEITDLTAFMVRIGELRQAGLNLREETELRANGREEPYDYLLLYVHQDDLNSLAQGLVREPGQAGWGSTYPLLQAAAPEVREKILSGEGA